MAFEIPILQRSVDIILREYQKFLNNDVNAKQARAAIGFQISSLKQYEIDDGLYSARSVTVIPTSSRIIDLLLIFNSPYGILKFELNLKPLEQGKYVVVTNTLSKFEDELSGGSATVNVTFKISKRPIKEQEAEKYRNCFLCLTRDTRCCYLNNKHDEKSCIGCCYGKIHSKAV